MDNSARSRITSDPVQPARLLAFSDGVFAIAVTLLVFNLKIPEIPEAEVHRLLRGELIAMFPRFESYLLSFLLIGFFWTIHHRIMDLIVRADYGFLWINNLYLLAISFIPFPTALVGTYPQELLSFIIYISAIFSVVALSQWIWWYANRHRLVSPGVRRPTVKYFYIRGATTAVILLLAVALSFRSIRFGRWVLILILPAHWIVGRYLKKQELQEPGEK